MATTDLSGSQQAILAGLAGGAGAFGNQGNSSGTSNTNTTGSSNTINSSTGTSTNSLQSLMQLLGNTSSTGTQTQQLGPEAMAVFAQLFPQLQTLQPFNSQAYQGQANTNINAGAAAQYKNVDENLAARGLAASPAAAVAHATVDANRIGQQTQVANSLPLVANQYNQGNISSIGSILAQLPRSVSTTGTTSSDQTQSGNQTGTGYSTNTGNSNTQSAGTQDTTTTNKTQQGGGIGGILGSVGGLLGTLFGLGKGGN